MSQPRRRAFSLLEVIIGSVLLVIVFGLVAQLLVPSLILFHSGMAGSEALQSGLKVTSKVRLEMLNTALESVTISQDGQALALLPKNPAQPFKVSNGDPLPGSSFVIFYLDPTAKTIRQKQWPGPGEPSDTARFGGAQPPRLSEAELTGLVGSVNGTERTLARFVESFQVVDQDPASPFLEPPIKISAVISIETKRGGAVRIERHETSVEVTPRSMRW
ncbi:MAG: hypothetical protein AB1758_23250 [Candidatus Eremiobacterota bacterium]